MDDTDDHVGGLDAAGIVRMRALRLLEGEADPEARRVLMTNYHRLLCDIEVTERRARLRRRLATASVVTMNVIANVAFARLFCMPWAVRLVIGLSSGYLVAAVWEGGVGALRRDWDAITSWMLSP